MYKGIYIALSGALQKQRHMDISAQNIANANTTGFKKERISFKDSLIPVDNKRPDIPDGRTMTETSSIITDFSKGALMKTGNPLDIAINGEGFFAIESDLYTRNGNFTIDNEGNLVTQDGKKVLGSGGPVSVQGGKIEINESGEIFVDGISVDTLRIVNFKDKYVLQKQSSGMFATDDQGEEVNSGVSQGYLETSNVNAVREMVEMIRNMREFESYQKMISAFDDASAKTINELGK
jgi:flagellar basal-body rod protein FlgG